MQTKGGASVSFQARDSLVESFDEWVGQSQYDSRSEALRTLMAQACDSDPDHGTPLAPPTEERLATAYKRLCEYASASGTIRGELATTGLASVLNLNKSEVGIAVLRKLEQRGYIRRQSNLYGDEAFQIVGWDDE